MKVNKHLVSLLLLALLASCFLFGAVAPQDATADSEDAAVDTKDDDSSSDASGPSDLEQQEADTATDSSSNGANPMMAPPTGGQVSRSIRGRTSPPLVPSPPRARGRA